MSLLDVDSWSREYEACSALGKTIVLKLTQRENGQNSVQYNRLTAAIQTELKQFEGEVKELKQKLRLLEDDRSIDSEEVILRKQQVDGLQTQLAQVHRKITQNTHWERAELFANTAGSSIENAFPTNNLSDVDALKQRQIDILERQNRGLDILSQTIARQKNLASQLGQEVESQNDILDNLADTMERVDTHVHVEIGNISEVDRRDSTWGYWLIIIVLFIAITIVSVV